MADDPKATAKRIKPHSARWMKEATVLAFQFCPSIYPCGKCNHPVVDGYTCRTCGDGDPRTNKKGVRVYAGC